MNKRLLPSNDLAFKKLFGSEDCKDILRGIIGDFFDVWPEIDDITISSPYSIEAYMEILKQADGKEEAVKKLRQTIKDVSADFKVAGFCAEAQLRKDKYFIVRALRYAFDKFCRNYGRQGEMERRPDGEYLLYSSLKPVYMLNILGYQQFTTDDDALRILTLYDYRRKKSLDREYLTIAFFELGKDYVETENQRHWRTCFNTGEASDNAPEYIKKAARIISIDNLEPEEREMINRLEDNQEVYKSIIYTAYLDGKTEGEMIGEARGEAKGEKEKAIAIAQSLFGAGMPISEISRHTSMTEDEIRKLAH